MEHEASTLCLQPILSRATIPTSSHVRPIALISFSLLFASWVGLPCFLFPLVVHLRATLVILLGDILKTCPSHRMRRFLFLSELTRKVFWCVSPNLRWSWDRKSYRSYAGIQCEMPRSYGNPFQQLASTPIRTTAQI